MASPDENLATTVNDLAGTSVGWQASAAAQPAGRIEMLLAAVFLTITAATMAAVLTGTTTAFDTAVQQQFQAWQSERADTFVNQITALGNVATLVAVSVGLILLLRFTLNVSDRTTVFAVASLLVARLVHMSLRTIVNRPRPGPVETLFSVDSSSFPSGHSMMSMVIYLTFAFLFAEHIADRRHRRTLIGLAILLSTAIGVTRLYLEVHYATDVIAGLAAGLFWVLACWSLRQKYTARARA